MSNRKIASALSIDKCTVNEYVRKAKTCNLSLKALLLLEGPELEAQMWFFRNLVERRSLYC